MRRLTQILTLSIAFAALLPSPVFGADIIGTWSYEVSNTPPEYAAGEITFKKTGDTYTAMLTVGGTVTTIDEVAVDGNRAMFKVFVEGGDVKIQMDFEGDVMTGKAESYDGIYMMKGKRK